MAIKRSVGFFSVLFVFSCSTPVDLEESVSQIGVFEEAPCPIDLPAGEEVEFAVRCGYVSVPEIHNSPGDSTLRLAVAIFPGVGERIAPEPLVIAPPGPGTSAIGNIAPEIASGVGKPFREFRDVVLIENRGLPLSDPPLLCGEIVDASIERLKRDLSGEETIALQKEAVRACRDRLRGEGINLDAFNFPQIASDMAMVLSALGYDKFSIYGTSAGTIVAQHVMRDYPERVSSVVIDSTAALGRKNLQTENPANASRILHRLFELCENDPACNGAYPGLESSFDGIIAKLNENPVTVDAEDPRTREPMEIVVNGDRLSEIFFMASAQTPVIPRIPGLIHQLAREEYGALEMVIWAAMPPPGDFSHGLGHSAMCSEFNTFTEDEIVFDGRFPNFEESLANMSWGPRALIENCATWEVESIASETRRPVESDVPTLLLAGELDSVTPPGWAREAAETLSNGYVFEIPGFGHSPTFSGPCPASLALQFLADPTKAPDASCISEMRLEFEVPSSD